MVLQQERRKKLLLGCGNSVLNKDLKRQPAAVRCFPQVIRRGMPATTHIASGCDGSRLLASMLEHRAALIS